ncbi:MAG TPA: flagellar hook capping FlgD N-terminal domain-containing protein [Stellaceae bacterium]|jgi:flagellar basal-body rod modification protein FlgD
MTVPATVTTLTQGTQIPNSTQASNASSGTNLTENNFLQLLTAQLEDQDPLNPTSPSDFAAELAQFSTATGVQNLNTTLTQTSGTQASGLIGHNVAVAGNALILGSGGTATGAFSLSGAATDVKVAISNSSGSVVGVLDLGAMSAGTQNFTWNGQSIGGTALAAGSYSFNVVPTTPKGSNAVTATTYSVVPVTAVTLGGTNGTTLDLGDGIAPVALSSVQQVF